jgi:20S proteasome alpha/beta subunit
MLVLWMVKETKFIKELREFYNEFWVDTSKDGDFGLIIAIRGEIYEHSSVDMSLSKYSLPYISIGSGSEYAYGVMYATDKQKNARNRVLSAVNAAIKFNPSCTGPVDIVSI